MEETFSLTDVEGELLATMEQRQAVLSDETPFQVLLLGDWSGRKNRGLGVSSDVLAGWRPRIVDRDNLDRVMSRLGAELNIPLADSDSGSLTISFNQLDDFHPDQLFNRLEVFAGLARTRTKLNDPKGFQEAAAEVRGWDQLAAHAPSRTRPASGSEEQAPPPPNLVSEGNLLDQILAGGSDASSASSPKTSGQSPEVSPEIFELAKAAVKNYLAPDIEEERDQLIATVDARIAGLMRHILHQPDFQALEAAWRGLDFLVTRLETGSELKLYLLDISFEEFKADLRTNDDLRNTAIYNLLVQQTVGTPGGLPWAVIAANYTFDFASGDPKLVERISLIAQEAGAPFIAGASAHLLGCESIVETPDPDDWREPIGEQIEAWWETLRNSSAAAYVGFALPRFLLRLPYGEETEPTEEFEFEEMPSDGPRHESYLWANPAFAVTYLLARGFSDAGWGLRPSDLQEIEGLPLHVYQREGESEIKPCAEVLLTLRAAEKIINRGLMPLLSLKDSDTIRLGMFQSIAGTQLHGPWTGLLT